LHSSKVMKKACFFWCVKASLNFEHYGSLLEGYLVEFNEEEILFKSDENYNLFPCDLILVNNQWHEITERIYLNETISYKLRSI